MNSGESGSSLRGLHRSGEGRSCRRGEFTRISVGRTARFHEADAIVQISLPAIRHTGTNSISVPCVGRWIRTIDTVTSRQIGFCHGAKPDKDRSHGDRSRDTLARASLARATRYSTIGSGRGHWYRCARATWATGVIRGVRIANSATGIGRAHGSLCAPTEPGEPGDQRYWQRSWRSPPVCDGVRHSEQ